MNYHGEYLPESFYEPELCVSCEEPSKKLNIDSLCPYCVEVLVTSSEGEVAATVEAETARLILADPRTLNVIRRRPVLVSPTRAGSFLDHECHAGPEDGCSHPSHPESDGEL